MIFIETPVFTSDLKEHLDDEEYRSLQAYLAAHPEAGSLLEDTGGLRKIRWAAKGKGKSGGGTSDLLRHCSPPDPYDSDLSQGNHGYLDK